MKSKKTILLILIIVASMIPEARAITPQSQTVKITDTHDDMFITEVGIGIDTSLVTIKDPEMDIRAFLVFRELDVNYWEPLKNATLRLHTSNTLSFDADSSITVYGMALSDLQLEGFLLPSTVLSIGFTDANTNYNTSEFYGSQWHEINVTDIVEELIRNPNWDGDGSAGTETGDAIGFHILGDEGYDKRYFYDYSLGNGLEAQLILHWNHEPPPPAGDPGADFNETYRGYHIWGVEPDLNENRTGFGTDVDWNMVNMTELSESDSGAAIALMSDTWAQGVNFRKSYTGSIYNDTGAMDVNSYFLRWSVNVTNVVTNEIGNDVSPFVFGLSNSTPAGGNGMSYGAGGAWVGLIGVLDPDDEHWRVQIKERDGLVDWTGEQSQWFSDASPVMLYFEGFINMTGANPYLIYSIYNDPAYTDLNVSKERIFAIASGSFRYPQVLAGAGQATTGSIWYDVYTYLDDPVGWPTTTWTVTDENGTTILDGLDDYEDALIGIDDILGADPEDPYPPGEDWEETGPFTRFRTRLYILLMGFVMLLGPLFYMVARRPSGYEIVIGLFIMLIGYSFLRAAAGI